VIRVLLADDEALVRVGLRLLLETASDITVVGEANDGHQAIEVCAKLSPDVVLLDVQMPGLDGIGAAKALAALPAPPKVVMLTTFDAETYLLPALRAGAHGFLVKDAKPGRILEAIRSTAAGRHVLAPDAVDHLVATAAAAPPPTPPLVLPHLTLREREVLAAVADGLSNAEIGKRLGVRLPTVKAHVSRIMEKLQCTNRVQVGLLAMRAGIGQSTAVEGGEPLPPDLGHLNLGS
jgi:DNA-binding NarL/FixJ family response regulator